MAYAEIMDPDEFARRMKKISEREDCDEEIMHHNADTLMMEVLRLELIDRQAAIKILRESEVYDEDIPNRADGVRDAIIDIMSLPTIEERKRGEWYLEEYPDGYYQAQCSECGFIYNEDAYNNFRFCPRCGADMRGEDDGTDK